jgi:hypothetical protein
MPLLNYTTGVAAERSVDQIRLILVRFGARRFAVDYDNSTRPPAVEFDADTGFGVRTLVLRANVPGVLA